jgi:putative flippase GtrA
LLSQGLRFAIAGAIVAGVYVGATMILHHVVGVAFEIALPTAFAIGLAVHFMLQRVFVWVQHEQFALAMHRQARRYLAISLAQYCVTASTTAVLPRAFSVSTDIVYLAVTVCVSTANFILFRTWVFHAEEVALSSA